MSRITKLEDRILILEDKIDMAFVKAGFDPSQIRDAIGRWTGGGLISPAKIKAALPAQWQEKAKDALAMAAATAITQFNNSDVDTEVVKDSIKNLAVGMQITQDRARERLISVLQILRLKRQQDLTKAEADPLLLTIERAIRGIDALPLE